MALIFQSDILFQTFSLLVLQKRRMAEDRTTENCNAFICKHMYCRKVLCMSWMAMDKMRA